MKILQVNKFYPPIIGGIETVVRQLSEGLCNRLNLSVLVCNSGWQTIREDVNGIAVTRAASIGCISSMPISPYFLFLFGKMCKSADIVQLHAPFPLGDLALFLSGYKGKVVVWWHSDVIRQKKLLCLYRPLMHWMLKRADRIFVATQGHIDGSSYLKLYEEKCRIIPYGLDDVYLRRGKAAFISEKKRKYTGTEFLFIGRLVYYKGCDVLLKAFSQMREKNALLTIIGEGSLKEKLKELSQKLSLAGRVRFLGSVEESTILLTLRQCDVLVLPSVEKSEAFGIVQLEAMAYGKPVINTELNNGVSHVSLHGITGITVPAGDIDALSKAMDCLAMDEVLCEKYGTQGMDRVWRYFSLPRILDEVYREYEVLLQ
jgi:Glycosyltransferase